MVNDRPSRCQSGMHANPYVSLSSVTDTGFDAEKWRGELRLLMPVTKRVDSTGSRRCSCVRIDGTQYAFGKPLEVLVREGVPRELR